MKTLTIRWQRLVEGGETCPRCGGTGEEVRKAAAALRQALEPLGIEVVLDEAEIGLPEFRRRPLDSNRILIGGRPIEEWLGGTAGQSTCCDVCGPSECRTLTVDGQTHETIPAAVIVRAGLLGAAALSAAGPEQPCCEPLVAVPRGQGGAPEPPPRRGTGSRGGGR